MFNYHNLSEKAIQKILKDADKNQDGVISFDEFEEMMVKGFQSKVKGPALGKRKSEVIESDRLTRS